MQRQSSIDETGMIIQKFKKFTKLSSDEKKLFLEAWLMLGVMRAAILTIPFKRLTRSLEQQQNHAEITPLNEHEMKIAITIGQVITRAANNTPWESACLAQSLTAQWMLKRRGIPGVFYLGVMKDEHGDEKMSAHAWSRCGETIITGNRGYEDFTVVSVFRWGR